MKEIIRDCPWDRTETHTQKVVKRGFWYHVVCTCGAKGPGNYTKDSAIESWNSSSNGVANNCFN